MTAERGVPLYPLDNPWGAVRLHADVKQLVPWRRELVQTFFEFAVRHVRVRDRLRRRRRVVIHAHRTTNLERRVQLQALWR